MNNKDGTIIRIGTVLEAKARKVKVNIITP